MPFLSIWSGRMLDRREVSNALEAIEKKPFPWKTNKKVSDAIDAWPSDNLPFCGLV